MSHPFPLPMAPQECYSKWYNTLVESGPLKDYTILWVGSQLTCRFKSDTIGDNIGPHNVFVMQNQEKKFAYAVIDNTDSIFPLAKKYFTTCFPGIQYNNIPKNNRVKIKITKDNEIEIPYIPQSFLTQKKRKTTRIKRKRKSSMHSTNSKIESIDFNTTHPVWHILNNEQNHASPIQKEILILIRNILLYADSNQEFYLESPFKDIQSIDEIRNDDSKMKQLKMITAFIYHFCRSELGCNVTPTVDSTDLQTWIGYLNNTATV